MKTNINRNTFSKFINDEIKNVLSESIIIDFFSLKTLKYGVKTDECFYNIEEMLNLLHKRFDTLYYNTIELTNKHIFKTLKIDWDEDVIDLQFKYPNKLKDVDLDKINEIIFICNKCGWKLYTIFDVFSNEKFTNISDISLDKKSSYHFIFREKINDMPMKH